MAGEEAVGVLRPPVRLSISDNRQNRHRYAADFRKLPNRPGGMLARAAATRLTGGGA
jgi:hypothetical protein